jgi:Helix-turn-helix domain
MDKSELMEGENAAKYLGVAPATLTTWRHRKYGPAYFKVGRLVYYRAADLMAWLQSQRRDPRAA